MSRVHAEPAASGVVNQSSHGGLRLGFTHPRTRTVMPPGEGKTSQ